jgi:hypothetical protein
MDWRNVWRGGWYFEQISNRMSCLPGETSDFVTTSTRATQMELATYHHSNSNILSTSGSMFTGNIYYQSFIPTQQVTMGWNKLPRELQLMILKELSDLDTEAKELDEEHRICGDDDNLSLTSMWTVWQHMVSYFLVCSMLLRGEDPLFHTDLR